MTARSARFGLGAAYLLLATPLARAWLETAMIAHMLVQIPLLVVIGVAACRLLPERWQHRALDQAGGAVPYALLALFASTYWMLPRALDAALTNPLAEAAKFVSLPAFVGLPLALAWRRLSIIGRGFVWTNFSSMLAVLGWLYLVAPERVCNSYLLNQQEGVGRLMIRLAVLLFSWWLITLFVGGGSASGTNAPDRIRYSG
ncbi:MAG TPA: hypothetical protein VIQ62_06925 [Burkholderiales bacterium]